MAKAPKRAAARPNFFIVGAPKCGTTAWFEYLSTHPQIFVPDIKEPHFFASDLPGKQWTKSQERYERLFARAGDAPVLGEASVMYLYSTAAAAAIRAFNPDSRILIFLRPQEDFLPSLHHQYVFSFAEPIEDFEKAWRLSGKRPPDTIPGTCPEPAILDYAAMGRFHEQVARYFDAFPAGQICIVRFADWIADPRATYLRILDFLGLPDDGRTDFPQVNEAKSFRVKWLGKLISHPPPFAIAAVGLLRKLTGRDALKIADRASRLFATPGYRTQISPELRAEIRDFYAEDNRRLSALLSEKSSGQSGSRRPM